MERAEHMLDEADKIGCRSFVSAADVVNGNYKLNLAFVANLFNMHPGFEQQVDGVDIDFSAVPEETREERSEFICWCVLTELVNVGSNIVILYNQRFFFANDWRKIIVEELLRDDLINPVKMSVSPYVCTYIRTCTMKHNAATNQIVMFVKVDETFTTIWLSRLSEVRVKVRRWPQSPIMTIFCALHCSVSQLDEQSGRLAICTSSVQWPFWWLDYLPAVWCCEAGNCQLDSSQEGISPHANDDGKNWWVLTLHTVVYSRS